MNRQTNRRDFLKHTLGAGVGFWVLGNTEVAHSRSPSEKLNIGIIGAARRGAVNTENVATENIVALCDIDENNLGKAAEKFPKARKYVDFRKLLDEAKDIDAVVISTTEHTHAFAAMPAIQLGKH